MKNKLILAFFIAVISLNVAAASLAIAWYATSRTLYINSIDISIDAERDLKISTSIDGDYVDHINHTEVEASGVFMPLTSAHSDEWMSLEKDMPVFYDETKYSELEEAKLYEEANRGYFSQKFYLKADDNVYVTLDAEKTFIKDNKEYNKSYAKELYDEYQLFDDDYYKDLTVEEIEERLNRIVKAMRYSILIKDVDEYSYTIIDPYKDKETLLGGVLDNDVDRYYDYFKVENSDEYKERVYGEVEGTASQFIYDEALSEDSDYLDNSDAPNAFNARHKKGIKTFNLEESLNAGLKIKTEESIDLQDFNNDVKPFHFKVDRDVPKEVVVSIYIEGWDLESVNYTMGAAFISDLSFKIERETGK